MRNACWYDFGFSLLCLSAAAYIELLPLNSSPCRPRGVGFSPLRPQMHDSGRGNQSPGHAPLAQEPAALRTQEVPQPGLQVSLVCSFDEGKRLEKKQPSFNCFFSSSSAVSVCSHSFINKMNTVEFKSATFPNAGSRHLLDDSVMESHSPTRGQAESSTLSSGISLGKYKKKKI